MKIRGEQFYLTKAEARALLAFAATDKGNQRLACVQFSPSVGEAFGTNGTALAFVSADDGDTGDGVAFTVPRATMADAAKVCGANWIGVRHGQLGIYEDIGEADSPATATFEYAATPEFLTGWRTIVPGTHAPNRAETLALSPSLLAPLALVAKAAHTEGCVLYVPNGNEPCPVLITIGTEWCVVIMQRAKE